MYARGPLCLSLSLSLSLLLLLLLLSVSLSIYLSFPTLAVAFFSLPLSRSLFRFAVFLLSPSLYILMCHSVCAGVSSHALCIGSFWLLLVGQARSGGNSGDNNMVFVTMCACPHERMHASLLAVGDLGAIVSAVLPKRSCSSWAISMT